VADTQLAVRLEIEPGPVADDIESLQQDRGPASEGDDSSTHYFDIGYIGRGILCRRLRYAGRSAQAHGRQEGCDSDHAGRLKARSATIDGEAVWCGPDGNSDFDKLHSRANDDQVFLYAFDLLELNGEDYRARPLEKRKDKLARLLVRTEGMRFSEHLEGDGAVMFEHVCKLGLEGIVSKRRDRPYVSGRSRNWIKVRNPASAAMLRYGEGTF
jgi:hypothetical protein